MANHLLYLTILLCWILAFCVIKGQWAIWQSHQSAKVHLDCLEKTNCYFPFVWFWEFFNYSRCPRTNKCYKNIHPGPTKGIEVSTKSSTAQKWLLAPHHRQCLCTSHMSMVLNADAAHVPRLIHANLPCCLKNYGCDNSLLCFSWIQ